MELNDNLFNRSLVNALVEVQEQTKVLGDSFDKDLFLKTKENFGDYNLPYSDALEVHEEIGNDLYIDVTNEIENILKIILMNLIFSYKPKWFPLKNYTGRDQILQKINEEESSNDIKQIFNDAGLFDDEDNETHTWWAIIQSNAYSENINEVLNGLKGEKYSMDYEKRKLISQGLEDYAPIRISTKNSLAGYDIESWEKSSNGDIKKIYIEVKYTQRDYVRFFLSRNEYDTAEKLSNDYKIHFWQENKINEEEPKPTEEFSFDWITNNVPTDNGQYSFWNKVLIDEGLKDSK